MGSGQESKAGKLGENYGLKITIPSSRIGISGLVNDKEKKQIQKAALWFLNRQKINKVKLNISVVLLRENRAEFRCLGLNKFQIYLNRGIFPNWQKELFHELQHLQQFHTKRLIRKNGVWYFKGKDTSGIDYWKQPEEIEARKVANQMVRKYKIARVCPELACQDNFNPLSFKYAIN